MTTRGEPNLEIPTLVFGDYCLRAFTEDDVDALMRIHSQPQVMRYLSKTGEPETTPREAWNYIAIHLGHWRLRGCGKWALANRITGELMGRVGYFDPPYEWPGLELGWTLAPEHWGKGLATQAAKIALAWGFGEFRATEIISAIHPENTASLRVAERLGERKLRETTLHGKPCWIFGMTHSEWNSRPSD